MRVPIGNYLRYKIKVKSERENLYHMKPVVSIAFHPNDISHFKGKSTRDECCLKDYFLIATSFRNWSLDRPTFTILMVLLSEYDTLLRTKASCQPTARLTSICPETEVNDNPTNLGVTCDQHVESPSRCCFLDRNYRYKWSHPNSSQCWVGTDPIQWPKISPQPGFEAAHFPLY